MKTYFASSLVIAAFMATGCTKEVEQEEMAPPVDLVAEQAAATAVVNQFLHVWETEDIDLLSKTFAHDPDMVLYGTDAAEVFVGYEALRDNLVAQFESYEGSRVAVRNQVVKVHASGQVAWFSELVDFRVTVGGEPVSVDGMRFTGVLEKRDGTWQIVQFHGSVPVAGQAVEY